MIERSKLEVTSLSYREILDLFKILRRYLQSMPAGEARDTAKALLEQLEPHVKIKIGN
ncbi:MAG: hypothetical protein K9L57_09635 [Spirochaetaceae bacterium]|nr:hypothetical protein [Spirochaetia bacterium]MCF7951882.1 hypothetical protein [Spirochaetaceae bacterium]